MFVKSLPKYNMPDENGYFGQFGGAYVGEDFRPILTRLDEEFEKAINDENFIKEFHPSNRKRFWELFETYGYRTVIFNIGEDLIQKRQAQALEEMELY